MRNLPAIILTAFVVLLFSSSQGYAVDESGCHKLDFLCKLTGKGAVKTDKSYNQIKKESKNKVKKVKSTNDLDESGCHKLDFLCKLTGKGAVKTDKSYNQIKIETKNNIKKAQSINNTKDTEISVYAGMFDFSDHKQKAGLFGLQHQNDELFRKSFLGKISPITGGFITENSATYFYTGAQAEYDLGIVTITPSFAPGFYNSGNGKDLGHVLEFKSEVQMTLNLSDSTEFGMSYNHISNASLGTKNPGANSYMVNFLKHF